MQEVKVIGQMDNTIDHTFESANRIYDTNGISPTVNTCGGGGLEPKVVETIPICLNSKGGRAGGENLQPSVQDRVYSTDGISTSVTTAFMPSILESQIVAMRGRNPDNSSDRTVGSPTEQRLEINSQGVCNTLTSVQKDNLVLEKQKIKVREATQKGYTEVEIGGGDCGLGISVKPNTKRTSNRERKDKSNSDNGEYP